MNIATSIAPGLLTAAYLCAVGTKLLTPKGRLDRNAQDNQRPVNAVILKLAVFFSAARTVEVVR